MKKRLNRFERQEIQKEKIRRATDGSGLYIYENNTKGDLTLPKPTASGQRKVGVADGKGGGRFQGDSYFMSLVGSPHNLLKFVEEIVPKTEDNMQQKLILD